MKMPIPFSHIFLMNYHVVPWNSFGDFFKIFGFSSS